MANDNEVKQEDDITTELTKHLNPGELLELKLNMEDELHNFLVPLAMSAYENLLTTENEVVKKQAADAIMELAGHRKKEAKQGATNNSMNFVMPPEMFKSALQGLEKVVSGEIQDV